MRKYFIAQTRKKDTFQDGIQLAVDEALDKKPKDFNQFLLFMGNVVFEEKRGKHIAFQFV